MIAFDPSEFTPRLGLPPFARYLSGECVRFEAVLVRRVTSILFPPISVRGLLHDRIVNPFHSPDETWLVTSSLFFS